MTEKTKESSARKLMQDVQDIHFRERVQTRVFEVLRGTPITFEHILRRSLNCDPAFLLEVLHELQDGDFISSTEGRETPVRYWLKVIDNCPRPKAIPFSRSATTPSLGISLNSSQTEYLRELLQEMLDSFPEPTPVYSQWWFSKSIYGTLVKFISDISTHQNSVAFLGSPTLGALFSQCSNSPVHIFDIDNVLLERISPYCSKPTRIIPYNVSDEIDNSFKGTFQLVFADPPWTSSLLRSFLIRSSTLVSVGGTLAISFPQLFTRPTIRSERKKLRKLASKAGLSLKSIFHSFTEYSVPLFEYKAYKRCGINLKKPWRKGDLFVYKKIHDSPTDLTHLIEKTPEWNQYCYRKSRLFLKRDGLFEDASPSVEPIPGLEDLTYKSTTSRMTSWKSASLISTRNRIAHAYGRKKLSALLQRAFKENHRPSSLTMPPEIKKIISDMLEIEAPQNLSLAKHEEV